MKIRKSIKRINFILIAFLILCSTLLFNNKTIEKETKSTKTKALDQEGQSYRLVTSSDNVQVPVPKGYVASQVTGENYVTPEYQHTSITHKVSSTPTELTWSSPAGEQYPWTQDENGIWMSGNQGIVGSTSTLESEEFDYIKGTTLTINYTYSSGANDTLNIDLINITDNRTERIVSNKYGNSSSSFNYITSKETWKMNNGKTGRYKIRAIYKKTSGYNYGQQDRGYIKASTYYKEDENGETIEEDIKTKIHDGGFVIYQLTEEELETDPNGTVVVINDTNKDEAQTTRNQYVWVPVANIEDIARTRVANNGIMQFGQNYTFSSTSITKETTVHINYYREPRLLEKYDETKYYLQKHSNINTRENYLNKMQEDFTRMLKSINKYKGFYIGRYETGDVYTHDGSYINPQIVRYNSNINWVTWYNSYKDLERIAGKTEKYVETGMLYDSLYDYTLKWLNETDTKSYEAIYLDSGTWGNYSNICFKYKDSLNGTEITKSEKSDIKTATGGITEIIYKGEKYSDSPTLSNNIFDIAGNIYELTRSTYLDSSRRIRGGNFHTDSTNMYGPAYCIGSVYPYSNYFEYGTRNLLLIK